ncbi:MAG: heat-inducible transcriptional repressor HrcA [Candidatus Omnitrophota bacterium]
MVLTREEIKFRKDRILALTIAHYIQTVTPVSSTFISNVYPIGLSSATIRNIFAELEEEGFLTHPHTSAGRIPTQKGYRYYVDNLMNEINLLEEEKKRIKNEYDKQSLELDNLLDQTSRVLSNITSLTSIISIDGQEHQIFLRGANHVVQYPDYQDIEKIKSILKALDEKEQLLLLINQKLREKVNIYIGQEIALAEMNTCSLVITTYRTKTGPTGRMAILGPTRMNYERVVSTLEYFTNLIEELS